MTATVCAFCEKHSHMTPQWANTVAVDVGDRAKAALQAVAVCDNCKRASLGFAMTYSSMGNSDLAHFNYTADANFQWFPRTGAAPEFPDVPEHIAAAAKEAHAARSINAKMAAILMARTVIEATAKAKQITSGNLVSKIDAMANQSIIRNDTKDAAHEIRHIGNDMAHGDISALPDDGDVEDVLTLMDEVLNEVFQGPAKTARLRARRAVTS